MDTPSFFRIHLLFLSFLFVGVLTAQDISYVYVKTINIEGHKYTKTSVIKRELDFQPGDSIPLPKLNEVLEYNRLQLMNTGLFTSVLMNIKNWKASTNEISVDIQVVEAGFIVPVPIFELADRNFNVWWSDYNHSLERINFGGIFFHNNLTGYRDVLKALLQFGFTNKYELEYTLPAVDAKQKFGIYTGFLYTRNREVNYATIDNKQSFFRSDEDILLQRFRLRAGVTYRPKLRTYHNLRAEFADYAVDEQVLLSLNEDFFLHGVEQRSLSLTYDLVIDWRDIRPYPVRGYYLALQLRKNGLGVFGDLNALYAGILYKGYLPFGEDLIWENILRGRYALIREQQPFYQSWALGYGYDYVRGYEYYVIDGLDFGYWKTSLHWKLFENTMYWGDWLIFTGMRRMPMKVFLSVNNDLGYANNPYYGEGNSLANELLWGYGPGLDIVVYYNKLFRFEYSRNRLGEGGFYIHWQTSF